MLKQKILFSIAAVLIILVVMGVVMYPDIINEERRVVNERAQLRQQKNRIIQEMCKKNYEHTDITGRYTELDMVVCDPQLLLTMTKKELKKCKREIYLAEKDLNSTLHIARPIDVGMEINTKDNPVMHQETSSIKLMRDCFKKTRQVIEIMEKRNQLKNNPSYMIYNFAYDVYQFFAPRKEGVRPINKSPYPPPAEAPPIE